MGGDEINDHEEIVRAIPFAKFSQKKNKISVKAFMDGAGVSVGRTAVLSLEELTAIFFKDLHHPPLNPLFATVSISVARLKAAVYAVPTDPPTGVLVVEDPVPKNDPSGATENPAHALVHAVREGLKTKFTEGQAGRILAAADAPRYF